MFQTWIRFLWDLEMFQKLTVTLLTSFFCLFKKKNINQFRRFIKPYFSLEGYVLRKSLEAISFIYLFIYFVCLLTSFFIRWLITLLCLCDDICISLILYSLGWFKYWVDFCLIFGELCYLGSASCKLVKLYLPIQRPKQSLCHHWPTSKNNDETYWFLYISTGLTTLTDMRSDSVKQAMKRVLPVRNVSGIRPHNRRIPSR